MKCLISLCLVNVGVLQTLDEGIITPVLIVFMLKVRVERCIVDLIEGIESEGA